MLYILHFFLDKCHQLCGYPIHQMNGDFFLEPKQNWDRSVPTGKRHKYKNEMTLSRMKGCKIISFFYSVVQEFSKKIVGDCVINIDIYFFDIRGCFPAFQLFRAGQRDRCLGARKAIFLSKRLSVWNGYSTENGGKVNTWCNLVRKVGSLRFWQTTMARILVEGSEIVKRTGKGMMAWWKGKGVKTEIWNWGKNEVSRVGRREWRTNCEEVSGWSELSLQEERANIV